MTDDWTIDEIRELAASYSLGALDPDEARAFEERLRADSGLASEEVRAFQETAARLALALPPVRPSPAVREKLLARIQPASSEPMPGIHVLRASEEGWRQTAFPGVSYKQLYVDKATDMATSLLRIGPGATYPGHRHAEVEQCLVLEGDLRIGELVLHAGDYERAQAATTHPLIESRQGCLLLIIASRHDELLA